MKKSRMRLVAISTGAALTAISLTGCTINIKTNPAENSMHDHSSMMKTATSEDYSASDLMFAEMMIPHHQQAVDMSTLAETRTKNGDVLTLAKQIKDAQAPEIEQMKGWLESVGSSISDEDADSMMHQMDMGGMLSAAEMKALSGARDAAFDKLYLTGMIGHHEGAIQMAKMILKSTNAEAKALAEAIVKSQTAEIDYMKTLLAKM